jgi:hypothetical protein
LNSHYEREVNKQTTTLEKYEIENEKQPQRDRHIQQTKEWSGMK